MTGDSDSEAEDAGPTLTQALLNATKIALREHKEELSTDFEDALPRWSVGKRSGPKAMLEARQGRQGRRKPGREPSSAAPMQRLPEPPKARGEPQPSVLQARQSRRKEEREPGSAAPMQRPPKPPAGRGKPPLPRPTQMARTPPRRRGIPIGRGRMGQPQKLPFRGPGGLGSPTGGTTTGGPVSPGAAYSIPPGAGPSTPPGGGALSRSGAQPQTDLSLLDPVSRGPSTAEEPGIIQPRVPVSPMKAKGAAAAAAQTHASGSVDVPIICNGNRGRFLLQSRSCVCHCKQCAQRAVRMHVPYNEMTTKVFEQHSGMGVAKKWKDTLHVDMPEARSCTLGAYLDQLSALTDPGRSSNGGFIQARASAVAAAAATHILQPATTAAKAKAFRRSQMSQK